MITYIVVDTGYLVELFKIPRHFNEENAEEVKRRFVIAKTQSYRLYIPVPVLFELANHIAHVDDGNKRRELVIKFSQTVKQGIDLEETFINIIPCATFAVVSELSNNLEEFVQRFADEFAQQGLGFTDSAVVVEAQSLKAKHNKVHIWTTDSPLKPYEPDTEADSFVGNGK